MRLRTNIPVCIAALLPLAAGASQQWKVTGGDTTMTLYTSMLRDLGIEVVNLKQTGTPMPDVESPVGFAITSASDLEFQVANRSVSQFLRGSIRHTGGFDLRWAGKSYSFQNFEVRLRDYRDPHSLYVQVGKDAVAYLEYAQIRLDRRTSLFELGGMDVRLSPDLARRMGRPELAGQIIGMMHIGASIKLTAGRSEPEPEPPTAVTGGDARAMGVKDVMLWNVSSLTALGRMGTFPNGVNGLAMSTTSCNVGTENIPWFAPMDERHPVIAQQLYRLKDGRLEQIGIAWVKHGFLSTNSSGCGTCQNPGSGQWLGVRCTDTYGASLNGSRTWLGPRDEINPLTGRWTCRGSYFAGYQDDCVDRRGGSFNPVEHRLEVLDADLNVPGALFLLEAYYISQDDFDRYNNAAWRSVTASWNGSNWVFSNQSAQTQGPVILSWGDMRNIAIPNDEGDAIVAVRVLDLGGGDYHYDFAVYVHTVDRQVRSFAVPLAPGTNVTNVSFRDIDQNPNNDWRATVASDHIIWEGEPFGNQNQNPIKYGILYNFRFNANRAPVNAFTGLGLHKPGVMTAIQALSRTPGQAGLVNAQTAEVIMGQLISGGVANLLFSDDRYMAVGAIRPTELNRPSVEVELTAVSPIQAPSTMSFNLETASDGSPVRSRIALFNYNTGQWEIVDERNGTAGDTTITVNISGNPSRFVQSGTGEMKARIGYVDFGVSFLAWGGRFDKAFWIVN